MDGLCADLADSAAYQAAEGVDVPAAHVRVGHEARGRPVDRVQIDRDVVDLGAVRYLAVGDHQMAAHGVRVAGDEGSVGEPRLLRRGETAVGCGELSPVYGEVEAYHTVRRRSGIGACIGAMIARRPRRPRRVSVEGQRGQQAGQDQIYGEAR